MKIARHLGNSLNNIIYIFDEPSAGLHSEEVEMLIKMLKSLKAQHNILIVIEHVFSVIKVADEIIEMSPSAGVSVGSCLSREIGRGKHANATTTLNNKLKINKHPRKVKVVLQ